MPKVNERRSRGVEADVAARIALEREHRGMSAAALARAMTELGCTINQSAINKIEQGDPPRRITVDEMVAFAKVFGLDPEELMIPAHAARDRALHEHYQRLLELQIAIGAMAQTLTHTAQSIVELIPLPDSSVTSSTIADAQASCDRFDQAFDDLTARLTALSNELKNDLRDPRQGAKVALGELRGDANAAYRRRAAMAATPPSPDAEARRKPKASQSASKPTQGAATHGQHQ